MSHRTYQSFLGPELRTRLIGLLEQTSPKWQRSDEQGRTGRGDTYQLSTEVDRSSAQLNQFRALLSSVVYERIQRDFDLPEPAHLDVQVFPVRMCGSVDDPPHQAAHVDNRDGGCPAVTTVYYASCHDLLGGEILLHGDEPAMVSPAADLLVAFPGDRLHEVLPLQGGERLSVVCNFYPVL